MLEAMSEASCGQPQLDPSRGPLTCYLGHEEHDQGDVGGEDDGKRGEGKGCVLLTVKDHGDRGSDETQHLQQGEAVQTDEGACRSPERAIREEGR